MARISGILCQIITGNVAAAGTDGRVYVGIGGREFRLDSSADDFEQRSLREYVLGTMPNGREVSPPQVLVRNAERNDPRQGLPLDSDNLASSPVYLRFEPQGAGDDWDLAFAAVLVYGAGYLTAYTLPTGFHHLWLGHASGKTVHLTSEWKRSDQALLDAGRNLATTLGARAPRT